MSVKFIKPWTWLWGLMAGFITGGAGALTVGPLAALFAPTELNIQAGLPKLLTFMSAVFVLAGVQGAVMYLAKSPIPQIVENGDTAQFVKT